MNVKNHGNVTVYCIFSVPTGFLKYSLHKNFDGNAPAVGDKQIFQMNLTISPYVNFINRSDVDDIKPLVCFGLKKSRLN
jgi:hypothetical protein